MDKLGLFLVLWLFDVIEVFVSLLLLNCLDKSLLMITKISQITFLRNFQSLLSLGLCVCLFGEIKGRTGEMTWLLF